ncbi:MAG: hypothetical protein WDN45_08980 [Caulobacteraceae bacterium]
MGANGQRVATALVYLNDEALEGGETDFPQLNLRHRGRKGDALVFFNVDASGRPDRRTPARRPGADAGREVAAVAVDPGP